MPEFILDTSGVIAVPISGQDGYAKRLAWSDLDAFTQGYIEAMFSGLAYQPPTEADSWSAHTDKVRAIAFSDLAPETLARIIADCAHFANVASNLGAKTGAIEGGRFWNARRNGFPGVWHELWGTAYPPLTPYLGDDGKVYLREGN